MASEIQQHWVAGGKGKSRGQFADFDLFIACCQRRFILERTGSRSDWLELAARFQEAKGLERYSVCAEYCLRKAGVE